jgi:hypothetical protein
MAEAAVYQPRTHAPVKKPPTASKKEKDRNPTSGVLPLGILADIDRD